MAKVKLTKGELKKQRDALRQYMRYLPTLQLKKQQLQIEILRLHMLLEERRTSELSCLRSMDPWLGLLSDPLLRMDMKLFLKPLEVVTGSRNIAGVDIPLFTNVIFSETEYDLFLTPLWVDNAIAELKKLISLKEEIKTIEKGVKILKNELRITTQRVNLFEKVKIPEAEETIRRIKIYIGDQMTNAVGRSKIAKRKIEAVFMEEAVTA